MLSLLAVGVTSCDPDMKDDVLHNAVYISEASTDNLSSVTLGEEGSVTSTTITLRLAQKGVSRRYRLSRSR